MGRVNPQFNDRVRYTLYNKKMGSLVVVEPEGWDDDQKEYARHDQYHGIMAKFSNSLKFKSDAADYINMVMDFEDINGQIELTRDEKHPKTDVWTLTYSGYLDLSTWNEEDFKVMVKFSSGGIEQLLKARESENVEIDRETTIDGKVIPPLSTVEVALDGRQIFLKSSWDANNDFNKIRIRVQSDDGNTRYAGCAYPLTLKNRSHEQAQSNSPAAGSTGDVGLNGRMIMAIFDRARTVRVTGKDLQFKPTVYPKNVNWAFLKVCVTTFKNGTNYELKERRVLFHAGHGSTAMPNVFAITNNTFSLNFDETFDVDQGDSLAVEFYIGSSLGSSEDFLVDFFEGFAGNVYVDEDSFFEPSKTKAILAHEFVDRLVTIATNKENAFYSDYLGRTDIGYPVDGKASLTGFSHGFWIRGFDKLPIPTEGPPKIENLFKPLTTSIKDCMTSLVTVWNVGLGIEKIGLTERVRIEELGFFFNRNVTIRLPNQVKKVKRSVAADKYYSSIKIGFKEGGDYEEACGLDEYNTKSNFTTPINRVNNPYDVLSEYRADPYGQEFTRREQKSLNETKDTGRDNSIWINDLKRGLGNIFQQRKWQDDFDQQPTGVFSPDTATNLRFSPLNCLLRSSWWFSGCLIKFASDYLRYGSSTANSQLKTKLIGKNEYAENGNIVNSELEAPRFLPQWIEFEHVCDFDVMQQVNGTTKILGKTIQNYYGLVEFTNEKNEIERGYLFNLKPNGNGNWKVLKSNR